MVADGTDFMVLELFSERWLRLIEENAGIQIDGKFYRTSDDGCVARVYDSESLISPTVFNKSELQQLVTEIPSLDNRGEKIGKEKLVQIAEVISGIVRQNFTLEGKVMKLESVTSLNSGTAVRNLILKDTSQECRVGIFGELTRQDIFVGEYIRLSELKRSTFQGMVTPVSTFRSEMKVT